MAKRTEMTKMAFLEGCSFRRMLWLWLRHGTKLPETPSVLRFTLAAPPAMVDKEAFREAMSTFPGAVAVVTALDDEGQPRGLTCSAVCSLSMDPPLLLTCVNQRNGSLRAIRHSGGFVVNLLKANCGALSDRFASASADKFQGVAWVPSPASGLPWLYRDVLAHVDCHLIADIGAGSHAILVGSVRLGERSQCQEGPLVYWWRNYGSWSAAVPEQETAHD